MEFKAALFDLDGTLLNSIEDLSDSMNCVLRKYNYPEHSISDYKYFVGDGVECLVNRALPKDIPLNEEFVRNITKEYRAEYNNRWHDKTRAYEGIPELLHELEKRNYILTIFSNKAHDFTELVTKYFFTDTDFRKVLGARDNFPPKPDPAGALEISRELNIPPSEFMYFGDTNTDMKTATGAGMYSIGVLWGFREKKELHESGAKIIIEYPLDILKILEKI